MPDQGYQGPCTYLTRPIFRDDLAACLATVLRPAVNDSARADSPALSESMNERTIHILLAEDNLINQKVTVAMLADSGYEVDTATDGLLAVEAATTRSYDAILMDCQMPGLSGYEATAAIRTHEGSTRRTPIIAMTAGARREDRERCLAAGMDNYLSKPVTKTDLLRILSTTVLDRNWPPAELDARARWADAVLDYEVLDTLRDLGESGQRFVIDTITQFLDDTESQVSALQSALHRGDVDEVIRMSHSIKGASIQVGGRRLASVCDVLEQQAVSGSLSAGPGTASQVEGTFEELRTALLRERDRANASPARHRTDVVTA